MKVCTDACLFGAWSAAQIAKYKPGVKNILDIGAGTGLLSLMLAQKCNAHIDSVEINAEAVGQAKENVMASPWENIDVHHTSIVDFSIAKKYEFVIANPPFYEGDLLSPDVHRNAAMHDSYLTLGSLIQEIKKHISPNGYAAVLLPFSRKSYFEELLRQQDFHVTEMTEVRQSVNHNFFRVMFLFSLKEQGEIKNSEISIYDNSRQYTDAFKDLLEDYYLAF